MTDEPDAGLAKPDGALRRGWTTGACATAATKAALTALLTGEFPDPVTIRLPKGEEPAFALALEKRGVLDQRSIWVRHAKRRGDATRIQSGVYEIRPGTTPVGELCRKTM